MSIDPDTLVEWIDEHARDLPWRRPERTGWDVLVSEIMLQQTPVARVLPVYEEWIARWPAPSSLAKESKGEAVRAWGKLGYPRRALRLHEAGRRQ
jgi:A/G-specific adenine glycosylase